MDLPQPSRCQSSLAVIKLPEAPVTDDWSETFLTTKEVQELFSLCSRDEMSLRMLSDSNPRDKLCCWAALDILTPLLEQLERARQRQPARLTKGMVEMIGGFMGFKSQRAEFVEL